MMASNQSPAVAGTIPGYAPDVALLDRITNYATVAQICIDEHEAAGREYAVLCGREMELEADRATKKQGAVLRLLEQVNPASGEAKKTYSATAAEGAAALDHEYRAHLQLQSEVVVEKHRAYTRVQTARLRAQLAVARLKAEAGVQ